MCVCRRVCVYVCSCGLLFTRLYINMYNICIFMYVYTYVFIYLRVLAFVCSSAQKMAGDEEFYLQIDSHMRFMQDWDEVITFFICGT